MRLLAAVTKRLHRLARIRKARSQISRLHCEGSASLTHLANAITKVLKNAATPEDKVWIDRIESLRGELNSSTAEISIVDYGAGTPDIDLTDEAKRRGRVVTRVIGDVCRRDSKPYFWSFLLFKLVREFRPLVCLELGTSLGISASYQAAAMKLNQQGKIVTLEGAESLAALAQEHFRTLGIDNTDVVVGRFQDTLRNVLDEHGPVDHVFIDGHHDEKATVAYFRQISSFLSERAVLVFDDISWSDGMRRAWRAIEGDRRVKVSVDLRTVGICVIDSSVESKQRLRIEMVSDVAYQKSPQPASAPFS